MHIDISFTRSRGKVYRRVLLRTSYREGNKVKHKTIANLSQESEETIEAIRVALKNKKDINKFLTTVADTPKLIKGLSIGAVYVLIEVAKRLSITMSLGDTRNGKLALWQIFARIIAQGSRLSAVRLSAGHAIFDLLKLDAFTEDELYDNLDWLCEHQSIIEKKVLKENIYLQEHPKAKIETAAKKIRGYATQLKIGKWVTVTKTDSCIALKVDGDKLSEASKFDGCYIIKTNVEDTIETTSTIIHARYKDLSNVEWAFRTMKTTQLEVRPYYVRKCSRTDAHVFVVMLAYKLIQYLRMAWQRIEITVEEGIALLANFHSLLREDSASCQYIPQPDERTNELLVALGIELPEILPYKKVNVATRKKLVSERKLI